MLHRTGVAGQAGLAQPRNASPVLCDHGPVAGRLAAKVVIVTGGASGIGWAVARRAVAEGAAVVIGGRRPQAGAEAAARLRAEGGQALFTAADVTVERDARGLVEAAVSEFGRLDGAVNNAGGVNAGGPVHATEDAAWQADLAQNLTSVFYCLKYQIPAMAAAGGGSVINNASIGGARGIPGMAGYVAAKHGVVGLTRSAALENAGRGVRVNALVTGNVDTPLYRRLLGVAPGDPLPGPAPNPSGRVASPEEIAAFAVFLLSDEAAFITGAALAADGGSTAQ
ncbi:MAG TPA: SDR family oxidoreductase [Streptosporangiaceae bacterium]|jgi:NAD(P)-dependent dehydrogenase (short-subunit alcohol dehydrogenase family)